MAYLRDRCAFLESEVAARDRVIADQARTLERVTSELRWHGLDEAALTVVDGFELWKRARQGDKAWPVYERVMQPMLRHLGKVPCLQVTPERWGEHRAQRLTEACGRWGHKAAPSSTHLDHELGLAKMLLRWLVRRGHLPRNPLDGAKKANEPSGRETRLSEADVQRLADGAGVLEVDGLGHREPRRPLLFRAFVLSKFGGGLRFEEARPLRRDRIGTGGVVELSAKTTKGKARRTVALPAAALEAIAAIQPLEREPYVFTHRWRDRVRIVDGATLRDWWHQVCRATGVDTRALDGEIVVPHLLRHAAASHLDAQGVHLFDIQRFLGHKDVGTTARYVHREDEERALRLRDLMGPRKAPRRAAGAKPVRRSRIQENSP